VPVSEGTEDRLDHLRQGRRGERQPGGSRATVRQGNAAQVLLDDAKGAELLVVGSRGHGGFTEALLGSVGQHCVHHATCPVVVIRDGTGTGQ
jgi:nucleotide-binding universal stress UspA family protein